MKIRKAIKILDGVKKWQSEAVNGINPGTPCPYGTEEVNDALTYAVEVLKKLA